MSKTKLEESFDNLMGELMNLRFQSAALTGIVERVVKIYEDTPDAEIYQDAKAILLNQKGKT